MATPGSETMRCHTQVCICMRSPAMFRSTGLNARQRFSERKRESKPFRLAPKAALLLGVEGTGLSLTVHIYQPPEVPSLYPCPIAFPDRRSTQPWANCSGTRIHWNGHFHRTATLKHPSHTDTALGTNKPQRCFALLVFRCCALSLPFPTPRFALTTPFQRQRAQWSAMMLDRRSASYLGPI